MQLTPEEMAMKNRIQLTTRLSKKTPYYSQYDNAWFKFPMFFEKESTNGLTIYKRVLKFLFNQAYNDNKNKKILFGGKSFEEYEAAMLQTRPFQLFLRHGKKLDRFYNRLEYKFDEETAINDKDQLSQLFVKFD